MATRTTCTPTRHGHKYPPQWEGHPLARDTIGASPSPTSPRGHLATHPPAGWQGSNRERWHPALFVCGEAALDRFEGPPLRRSFKVVFPGIANTGLHTHIYIYI